MQSADVEIPIIHEPPIPGYKEIQAKVPKLEIRSPVLGLPTSIASHFTNAASDVSSPFSPPAANHPGRPSNPIASQPVPRRATLSSTSSRIPQVSGRRARSSEHLSVPHPDPAAPSHQPTSPFSFSLSTPNPALFSFKMFDKGNERRSVKSRSVSSSPTALLYPPTFNRR